MRNDVLHPRFHILSDISIGEPNRTKSFCTHNFSSLKKYPVIIRGNITTNHDSSRISLSARTRAPSGNSNMRNRFRRLVLTPIYGQYSLVGPNLAHQRPYRKCPRLSRKTSHFGPWPKPGLVPSPVLSPPTGLPPVEFRGGRVF